MSTTTTQPTSIESGAIYHELNPKLLWLVRIVNIITLVMVVIAVIICIVQASKDNPSYYLLICNLVISGLVCIVVNWWYKKGDLGSEKFWFIILIGAVIFLQCIATDLFVFKEDEHHAPTITTPFHNTTKAFSWVTNASPTTKRL